MADEAPPTLRNSAAQPERDSQPESGIDAALGGAFNTSGRSNLPPQTRLRFLNVDEAAADEAAAAPPPVAPPLQAPYAPPVAPPVAAPATDGMTVGERVRALRAQAAAALAAPAPLAPVPTMGGAWVCTACTFENPNPNALVCDLCNTVRPVAA